MKKHLYPALSSLAILSTMALQAQKDNPVYRHLPPNSEKVYHINTPVLGPKADWSALIKRVPLKSESDQQLAEILKDPTAAGIDLGQAIFIAESPIDRTDSSHWVTAIIHIADSAKFSATYRRVIADPHTYTFPGKGRAIGNKKEGVAYSDKLAIFSSLVRPKNSNKTNPKPGTAQAAVNIPRLAAQKSLAALAGFDNNPFLTDQKFQTEFADDADFHMMSPQESMKEAILKLSKSAKLGNGAQSLTAGMKSNRIFSSVRFDIGKITMRVAGTPSQDVMNVLKAVTGTPLNTDALAQVPGTELLGMADLHFSPAGLLQLLQNQGIQGKIDSGLTKMGLSSQDVIQAFTGDFVFSATQGVGDKPVTYFFTATVNNLASFQKLAERIGFKQDEGTPGQGTLNLGKLALNYRIKGKTLALSASQSALDAYFNNTAKRDLSFINDRISKSLLSIYVDIKTVSAMFANAKGDGAQKQQQAAFFLQMLQSLTINFGNITGPDNEFFLELKMADQQENSLKTLSKLLQ